VASLATLTRQRRAFGDLFPAPLLHSAFVDRHGNNQKVLNVRRDNDNADQDTSSYEVPSGLTSWTGANEGLITEWSDLTGNGNHFTQSTAAEQPKVVSSGSIITDSGYPGADFGALSEAWDISASNVGVSGYDLTGFLVWNSDVATAPSQSGADSIFSFQGNQADTRCYFGLGTSYTNNRMGARWGNTTAYNYNQDAPSSISVLSFILTETDCDVWLNATQIGNHSITQGGTAPTLRSFRLGGAGAANRMDGRFYEVIAYDEALSTSDRSDIASYLMDYYSIT